MRFHGKMSPSHAARIAGAASTLLALISWRQS
jgi:hypothetical protein